MNGVGANAKRIGRVPRYHRIAETLREQIRGGALAPGARLDNQRELAKSFAVTLMTLRQALELLEREHLITRRHGLGTFVGAPSIDYDILQLRRFAGDLSAKGEHVATRFLGARFTAPDRRVAEALQLPARARVFVLERLRLVDDHPMSLQRSFLPPLIGDEVVRADLARTPLHRVLEFKLGVVIVRAHETVSAVSLGRPRARDPGGRAGDAAVESRRTSRGAGGPPVVIDRGFIPSDCIRHTRGRHY